ncbi:MAG: tetratricopeptide repeat protein [Verrucomicrobia bacterium]|nr:tetratricopeptide repeat protein [Verrucomicrobiota bacterium]
MRPFVLQSVVALAALGTLFGCASAKKAQAPAASQAAATNSPLSKEELEKRVEALARFAAGVSGELREQPDDALEQFYKSLLADPSNEPLAIDVARRFIRKKQSEKAIEVLSKSAEQPNATGLLDALLGVAYLQANKPDLAIASSRRAIVKLPSSLLGYQNLAQIYLQTDRPKEALATLDEAAALPSPGFNFLLDLAESYRNHVAAQPRDFATVKPKVTAILDAATKLEPKGQNLIIRMAELWSFAGEYKRAAELYVKLIERFPNQTLLRNRAAELFHRANDPKAAQAQFDALVRDQPTNPLTHYFLGTIAAAQKDWDKAVESYERAIQLNEGAKTEVDQFYFELAEIHLRRDDPDAALKLLATARKKFKLSFFLEYFTGLAHSRAKDYAASVKHFTAAELLAKRDDPERLNGLFFFQVGTAYERHKDFKQAENYFRQALKLAPDFAEVLNYLGYMWADLGENLTEAKTMIEQALKQEPENAAFLDSMAWVLHKLNQPKEALVFQLKALQFQKEPDATLHDHLGDIYAALKQPGKAREHWQKALAIEPSDVIQKKLKAAPADP